MTGLFDVSWGSLKLWGVWLWGSVVQNFGLGFWSSDSKVFEVKALDLRVRVWNPKPLNQP